MAKDAGPTGNKGIIGWYIPPWMPKKYPGITNWKNLNKYATLFKTSESGGKGQFLDGDPAFVTNDAALVKNLHLNYKVVYAGSEAALIQAFRTAQQQKKPLIGVLLPAAVVLQGGSAGQDQPAEVHAGLRRRRAKVACDYPPYHLDKIVSKKFATPAARRTGWSRTSTGRTRTRTWLRSTSPPTARPGRGRAEVDRRAPGQVKAWLQ